MQAAKQVLDRTLPNPVSYADLCAIAGAVGVYATKGPLINVGYGRPDATSPDPFQGVGSNTNQQRDYPIQEIINEWGEPPCPDLSVVILSPRCKLQANACGVQACLPCCWLLFASPAQPCSMQWVALPTLLGNPTGRALG